MQQDQYQQQPYPILDPTTGMPYSQTNTSSLIESQDSKLIEWILNPDNIIRQLENTLRGVRTESKINPETGDLEEMTIKETPMMNDLGIKSVIRTVRAYLTNPAFSTTDLAEENIREMTLVFGEELMTSIVLMYEIWDLRYEDIGMLKNIVTDTVYATLMRSRDGHLIKYVTQSYSEKYISSNAMGGNMPRKRGIFGKLFGAYA